jgi:signal recognition particle receptor subunit beta
LVAINENDITLIQNVEQFQTAFVEQKINQTFEIKDTKPENVTDSLIKELAT